MRLILLSLTLLALPLTATAGTAEARDLARSLNCQVANIAVTGITTGREETTDYKVGCTLPASASEEIKKANGTLLIRCDGALCRLLKKGE